MVDREINIGKAVEGDVKKAIDASWKECFERRVVPLGLTVGEELEELAPKLLKAVPEQVSARMIHDIGFMKGVAFAEKSTKS